jgi:hypothetical protein
LQRIASPGIDPTLYDLPRFIYMMMMKWWDIWHCCTIWWVISHHR